MISPHLRNPICDESRYGSKFQDSKCKFSCFQIFLLKNVLYGVSSVAYSYTLLEIDVVRFRIINGTSRHGRQIPCYCAKIKRCSCCNGKINL